MIFSYIIQLKFFFGKESLNSIPEVLNPYKRILFLYSGNVIKDIGLYDRLKTILKDKEILEFNNIESNPDYDNCMECVEIIRKNPVDLILSIGGGSVIDAGKFISAATFYEGGEPWDMLSKEMPIQRTIPVSVVLTLAATGSEMNCNSVISRYSTKEKLSFSDPKLFPIASFLDPTITYTLPERQTSNGIIDSFVHVLEQYLAVNDATDLQDSLEEGILKNYYQTWSHRQE